MHRKEQLLQHSGKPHLGLKFPFHLQAEEHARIINDLVKWLLQVHKHARCSRKLSATTLDSRAPAMRAPGSSPVVQSQWLELWQQLPAPLSHLHPPKDRLCHRADHSPDSQVLSSFGPSHSLVVAHGRIWPQGPLRT